MAKKTKAELLQQNTDIIYPNTNREITEQKLHDHLEDIIDSSSNLIIPKIFLKTKKIIPEQYNECSSGHILPNLYAWYDSFETTFLKYNPQVWLFRSAYNVRNIYAGGELKKVRINKYVHPPHLNGVNFPHSAYYGGLAANRIGEAYLTEYFLSRPFPASKELFQLPIDIYQWILYDKGDGWQAIDEGDVLSPGYSYKIANKKHKYIKFKFAIVCDNPNFDENNNPKIIGEFSDNVYLRLQNEGNCYKIAFSIKK